MGDENDINPPNEAEFLGISPMEKPQSQDMTHEAFIGGRWRPCRIVEHKAKRILVQVEGLVGRRSAVDDGRGLVLERRSWQVRPRRQQ